MQAGSNELGGGEISKTLDGGKCRPRDLQEGKGGQGDGAVNREGKPSSDCSQSYLDKGCFLSGRTDGQRVVEKSFLGEGAEFDP